MSPAPATRRARPLVTLALLVLVSATIISLSVRGGGTGRQINSVRSFAHDVFSPVQDAVDDVTRPMADFVSGAVHAHDLEAENARLRFRLQQLEQQVAAGADVAAQLKTLQGLEHLPFAAGIPTVAADVVAFDASDFADTVQLDQGTSAGVEEGMPVVDGAGLVGTVVQAWRSGSTVRLVTDADSAVGVRYGRGAAVAVVAGQASADTLAVDGIPERTPLRRGELLVTSGLEHEAYPPGLPVARVTSFTVSAVSAGEVVSASPVADLGALEYVDVLLWEPTP